MNRTARIRHDLAGDRLGGALIVGAGALTGWLALYSPVTAALLCAGVVILAFLTQVGQRLPAVALGFLGVCLVGYAVLGKGFAYLGYPPLFVGELALGVGTLALFRSRPLGALRHVRGLLVLLAVFMAVGLVNTLPYLGSYGITALRDGATWAYALFAVIVSVLVVRLGAFSTILKKYGQLIPLFLVLAPLGLLLTRLAPESIPQWPGSGAPVLLAKGGDVAVQLAGIFAFVVLGLHRLSPGRERAGRGGAEWIWWILWFVVALSALTGRAALVTLGASVACILLLRPGSRWGRPLYVGVLLVTLAVTFNLKADLGVGREVSVEGLVLNAQSVTGNTGSTVRDGSRTWRLEWWGDIVNYTVNGPYFWMGKGYGINLADADGFQVTEDHSLRNPHNAHMTFLARSGVPGFLSWTVLQLAFAWSLLMAFVRARTTGRPHWAGIHLWLLTFWLAFVVNASFDVFLEGPQGGIWFWSVFGLGLAALELFRREERA